CSLVAFRFSVVVHVSSIRTTTLLPRGGHPAQSLTPLMSITSRNRNRTIHGIQIPQFQISIAATQLGVHITAGMSLAEILPNVSSLSAADKLRLIRLLAEQVDLDTQIAPLEHGGTYVV